MLITPRPGVSPGSLIQALQSVHTDAFNLLGGGGASTAHERLLAYLEWASRSARMLGNQITESDLASLVLNRRYEVLLSSFGTMASPDREVQRVINDLVSLELAERLDDFDEAINAQVVHGPLEQRRRPAGAGH